MSVNVSWTPATHYYAIAVVSLVSGIIVGRLFSGGALRARSRRARRGKPAVTLTAELAALAAESDGSDESDCEAIDSTALNDVPGDVRMTLVVRQDLRMGKGKAAAQCLHAALALYRLITEEGPACNPEMVRRWLRGGQAKITLQVPDQEAMDMLYAQAMLLGVNAYIVHDAGRTQVAAGSATVLGLGPAPKTVLDEITGELKLY